MDLNKRYDDLYKEAEIIWQKQNYCEIKEVVIDNKKQHLCLRGELCCSGCKWSSDTGCTTKCLFCKLWMCPAVSRKYPELVNLMTDIYIRADRLGLCEWRKTKQQTLKKARRKREEKSRIIREKACKIDSLEAFENVETKIEEHIKKRKHL